MGYSTFMVDDCRVSQETLTPTINALYVLSSVSNTIHVCSLLTGYTSTVHFCPSYCCSLKGCCQVTGGDSYSPYHLCSVHVLCVCVLFVICCVYLACLCVRVCCVTRRALSTLEVDMALLSVSRLVCGAWSLEQNVVLTVSLLTHLIVSCVSVSVGCF